MPHITTYDPESEQLENLTKGWVMANRINDIWASPITKRYREYLDIVQHQFIDRNTVDPDAPWRFKQLDRAIEAYEHKNGVRVARGRLFSLADYRIAAAPDATEDDLIGLTIHCRKNIDRYNVAVSVGVTPAMERLAQAMMWVTGIPYWIHAEYFEDAETRTRKLYEHEPSTEDHAHKEQLGDAMIGFYMRSRLRANA